MHNDWTHTLARLTSKAKQVVTPGLFFMFMFVGARSMDFRCTEQ